MFADVVLSSTPSIFRCRSPSNRTVVFACPTLSFGSWNGGLKHLSRKGVRIFLLTAHPLTHHPRPQCGVIRPRVLSKEGQCVKSRKGERNRRRRKHKTICGYANKLSITEMIIKGLMLKYDSLCVASHFYSE